MQEVATTRLKSVDPTDIQRAVQMLRDGLLVAIPTETVYGLAARSDLEKAIQSVYDVKSRHPERALSVLVRDYDTAKSMWDEGPWLEAAKALATHFWPGPLTIICPSNDGVSTTLRGGKPSVGLRSPAHPIAQEILTQLDIPLVAPSANISQAPSPTSGDAVAAQLSGKIAAIVDSPIVSGGLESSIVELSAHGATLTRAGAIALPAINAALPPAWKISEHHTIGLHSSRLVPSPASHPISVEIYVQGTWRAYQADTVDGLIQGLHSFLSSLSDGERGAAAWRAGTDLRQDSRFAGVCYLIDRYLRSV